jgi:hypothetical protein
MIGAMDGHAMDQGVRDGSRINRTNDGSGSNERSDGYCKRRIREKVMDQGASYKSGSDKMSNGYYYRWIRKQAMDQGAND